MQLQFVGCGDAFGSGGRFNTCFHLVGSNINALIDCGATSLVSMNKLAINRNAIDTILFTHFHADHFSGLPFFILEANYVTKRQTSLTLAGPPGLKSRYAAAMETAFPGTQAMEWSFPLSFREFEIGKRNELGPMRITPLECCMTNAPVRALVCGSRRKAKSLPIPAIRSGRIRSSRSGAMPTCSSARPIRATNRSPRTWR